MGPNAVLLFEIDLLALYLQLCQYCIAGLEYAYLPVPANTHALYPS